MARKTDSRDKAIETAERLFRAQGYAATGLSQILAESGSPKGSFYYHFPGGKEELASEVLSRYANRIENGIRRLGTLFANDPEGFVGALFEAAGKEMEINHWIGCAAQILVQELPPNNQKLRRQLSTVYKRWIEAVAIAIRPDCESEIAAEDLATLVIAALNGARTLARAARSQTPFFTAADRIQKTAFGHKK